MTQSAIYGEAWSYIRDYQDRGTSERDARELFHITKVEFEPPSRAHLKRVKRKRCLVLNTRPKPPLPQPEREDFNRVRAGAMEIVSILRPNYVQAKIRGTASLEANPPKPPALHVPPRLTRAEREHDAAQADANHRLALRRDFLVSLNKGTLKCHLNAQTSLEALEMFGSWEEYGKACK